MNAELEAVLCSGPIRGAQHTYVLVDERITAHADGDASALAYRFFAGHGPASVKDLARWSSLTVTQSQEATEGAAYRLESEVVEGSTLYATAPGQPSAAGPRALLLPLYDELTLSYPMINFPEVDQHPHPPGADRFVGLVIIDGVNVGTWRRTVRGRTVVVELSLAPSVPEDQRRAAEDQARRLGAFLDRRVELVSS